MIHSQMSLILAAGKPLAAFLGIVRSLSVAVKGTAWGRQQVYGLGILRNANRECPGFSPRLQGGGTAEAVAIELDLLRLVQPHDQ